MAINISEKQLETARRIAPGCNFFVMNSTELGFEDCSIDNIICVEAAFHFFTRKKFFKEALRVLKPGGRLVLSDVLMGKGVEQHRLTFHEENFLSGPDEYALLAQRTGFVDIKVQNVTEPCWHGHYNNRIRFAHQKFFDREINVEQLQESLKEIYRLAKDLKYYLLVSLKKPKLYE